MNRVVLIGLDGAEPSLVEPWMDAGLLPNLARLRQTGAYMPCSSVTPPATFPAWTTCTTGVNPGKHGIFDFTQMLEGQRALRFTNSTFRKAPALWNILSEAGRRCCILGVPGTYPPEPIDGVMVAGFDSPIATRIDASFVYPRSAYDTVRDWRFADFQENRIGPGWHAIAINRLMKKLDDKEAVALRLLKQEPWDFFMVVFGESDTVAHHFWLFHDHKSPRHHDGFDHAIRDVYQRLDAAVGRLIAAAGDATIAIVSDHGFGGAGTGVVHLNNWLAKRGHLRFASAGEGSLLKRLALEYVPQQFRGALFRRFEGIAARAESKSRFSGIDWANTRAWSEELNYFPSIRINLRGRDPNGQVAPHDYRAFCDSLCDELEAWGCVAHAWRRDELYAGAYVDRAPDIVLELALENGYSHSCLRSRGGPPFRRIRPDEFLGGKERGMTGNHRPTGVLFLSKPVPAGHARLEDIAPTVLAELEVAGPPMDGSSLLGAYRESGATTIIHDEQGYSTEQESEIEARLRDLGYFE